MSANDDDRIAYLAGEPTGSLSPAERAELDQLRGLLATPSSWVDPPADLERRVVAAIAAEANDAVPSAEPSTAARAAVPRRTRLRLPRPTLPRLGAGLAAVAAVAVLAVVLATADSSSGRQPLQFAMVVQGTPLAPGAHGRAHLTKTASGWRIELSATGLPHLANGRYYQAWLKDAAGILVPVGTFNDARRVTLWSGVPVTQYRTLTVTRQLADGNPASSGQRVLIGTIVAKR